MEPLLPLDPEPLLPLAPELDAPEPLDALEPVDVELLVLDAEPEVPPVPAGVLEHAASAIAKQAKRRTLMPPA